jgi:hypothetical protein
MARVGRSFADLPLGENGGHGGHGDIASLGLWDDLIAFALRHNDFLVRLMDFMGICQLDPTIVLHRVDPHETIPHLRQKLIRIIHQQHFQVFSTDKCAVVLENDALALLRQQNQGQRRAIKVESNRRCSFCLRPLFMEANTSSGSGNFHIDRSHLDKSQVQVWGPHAGKLNQTDHVGAVAGRIASGSASGGGGGGAAGSKGGASSGASSGAVVFSNKLAFHKFCYERLQN